MRYNTTINNVKALEWGLNIQQAYLFSWFYELPAWADKIEFNGTAYYFASKNKAVEEMPMLTDKTDTMYRFYKQLEALDLIKITKVDNKDYIALTEKSKKWNNWQSDHSEKNPTSLGFKSETNSDNNPTYNNITSNNIINDDIEKAANEKSFATTLFPAEPLKGLLEEKEKSIPPPAPPPPKKEKEYSSEVKRCFKKCIVLFDEHLRPQNKAQQNNWLDTIDKLHNLDGIPFENIIEITTKARADINFWAKNFLSLVKLRKTNKEGIKYIIVFSEQFKTRTPVVNLEAAQQADKEMLEYLKM